MIAAHFQRIVNLYFIIPILPIPLIEQNGKKIVQPDLMLSAIDIVADPSAPGAFVNGIMEGKEWVWNNGSWYEQDLMEAKRIIKKSSTRNLEKKALTLFENFFRKL